MSNAEPPDLLEQIRARRTVGIEQATQLIALSSVESDTANRLSLLRMAERSLEDPAVSQAWIDSVAAETDPAVRWAKLAAIADLLARSRVHDQQFAQAAVLIGALVEDLGDQGLRPAALAILRVLALRVPDVAAALAVAYQETRSAPERAEIVRALAPLRYSWDGMTEFLLAALPDLDSALKADIVGYLYRRRALDPAALVTLLTSGEAPSTRLAVLTACNDESLAVDPAVVDAVYAALANDPDATCRAEAAAFVERYGSAAYDGSQRIDAPEEIAAGDRDAPVREVAGAAQARRIDALLDVAAGDADPMLRRRAAQALARIGGLHDGAFGRLTARVMAEPDAEAAAAVLGVLAPYVSPRDNRGAQVRAALLSVLETNIATPLAVRVIDLLRRAGRVAPEMAGEVLERYAEAGSDTVAGALLDVLADEAWVAAPLEVFAAACQSTSARVRQAGLRALSAVAFTPDHETLLLAQIPLVNDPAIAVEVRRRFARKVALTPAPSASAVAAVRTAVQGLRPGDPMRADLEQLLARPAATQDGIEPEWEIWRDKLHQERRTDAMLPAAYLLYTSYPAEAAALLSEVVKTGGHEGGRWGGEFHTDWAILSFLVARGAIDDEMCRFALSLLLGKDSDRGNLSFYLSLLKSKPDFPDLPQVLWDILERPSALASVDTMLLLETMLLAHHSDTAFVDAYLRRAAAITTPAGLRPYIELLAAYPRLAGAAAAVATLHERQASLLDADPEVAAMLADIYAAHGLVVPPRAEEAPGEAPPEPAPARPIPGVLLDE